MGSTTVLTGVRRSVTSIPRGQGTFSPSLYRCGCESSKLHRSMLGLGHTENKKLGTYAIHGLPAARPRPKKGSSCWMLNVEYAFGRIAGCVCTRRRRQQISTAQEKKSITASAFGDFSLSHLHELGGYIHEPEVGLKHLRHARLLHLDDHVFPGL